MGSEGGDGCGQELDLGAEVGDANAKYERGRGLGGSALICALPQCLAAGRFKSGRQQTLPSFAGRVPSGPTRTAVLPLQCTLRSVQPLDASPIKLYYQIQ